MLVSIGSSLFAEDVESEWGKTSATELIHSIDLFAYHEGAVSYYLASAHCNRLVSPATVDLYL